MADKKVTVHLSGGLGNQMFQYMAGAGLAKNSGRELVLNVNWFLNPTFLHRNSPAYLTKRKIDILQFETVGQTKVDRLPTPRDGRTERLLSAMSAQLKAALNVTSEISFNHNASKIGEKSERLFGFFMSPKYFLGVDPKKIFANLKSPLSSWSLGMQELLHSTNSIGVHIRLGDYVALGDKVIPTETYFLKGIEQLVSILGPHSKIYLFTDEPERLKVLFPRLTSKGVIVTPPNRTTAVENLIVLSSCDAFVCSNSTFSWWGATLSNASETLVVRPSYFYTAKPGNDSHSDLWSPNAIHLHPLSGEKS
jgi:hypothetical protein